MEQCKIYGFNDDCVFALYEEKEICTSDDSLEKIKKNAEELRKSGLVVWLLCLVDTRQFLYTLGLINSKIILEEIPSQLIKMKSQLFKQEEENPFVENFYENLFMKIFRIGWPNI
jgi:high-affinity nickel permease